DIRPLAQLRIRSHILGIPRYDYKLDLAENQITDISPLAEQTLFRFLDLSKNPITDIQPLAEMGSLYSLNLSHTNIRDTAPLSSALLSGLSYLNLSHTQIQDIEFMRRKTGSTAYLDEL